jgi:hypothetical protein
MEAEELVRRIVREVLRQLEARTKRPCARVLAGRDGQLAARILARLGEDCLLLFQGEDDGGLAPERYILPCLSCSAMAELAVGGASGKETEEVLRLLLSGKQVEVLEFAYKRHAGTAPESLYGLYAAYEKRLAAYGLRECASGREEPCRVQDTLITEKLVLLAQARGASVLRVPREAMITPLAADTARELRVEIEKIL